MLIRPRDAAATAADVADMRRAIAQEKGEDDFWDLKYAAGGTVDIDFIAQHLQLVHAADKPEILSVTTTTVLDNAARLGVLAQSDAEVLRAAVRLYHDLTQIIRLCVSGKFNPATAGVDLLRVMARAGDTPDFSSLAGAAARDPGRGAAGVLRGCRRRGRRQLIAMGYRPIGEMKRAGPGVGRIGHFDRWLAVILV